MTRRLFQGSLAILGVSLCILLTGFANPNDTAPSIVKPTFYKDVLPILQNNCQNCHRPGEVAPMSLLTYEDARPWALAMKTAVLTKKMPPWYADPQFGHFSNERKLTPQQIKTLVSWVDGGALAGNPKDKPAPMEFVDGWNIGKPDKVIEMPAEFHVPAEGTVDYQYVVIPGGFTQDTWVKAAEVRPGNRALVHHVIAFIREPGSQWMRDAKPGEFFQLKGQEGEGQGQRQNAANKPNSESGSATANAANGNGNQRANDRRRGEIGEFLIGYAPGLQPLTMAPDEAKLVKAGSDIVFQLHYTANGTAGVDRTRIGLVFADRAPKLRDLTISAVNPSFKIPPNDSNYEVKSQVQLEQTVTLSNLLPHMHFRGKDFRYDVIYPDGRTETLLSVPKYDFNWQLEYTLAEPIVLPKGTRIECTAHYDNSVNNPYNPDPNKEVRWGEQTWEEMMIGFFDVTVDVNASTAGLYKPEKPGTRDNKEPDAKPAGAATGANSSL